MKTPEEFANSLTKRISDLQLSTLNPQPAFHAVAIGSTFEWPVLKALGAIGGGSVRRLSGEQGPVKAARELLIELASPGLRDVKVEFTGLRTAALYPETLPNLPFGSQQIVLGRYLPRATRGRGIGFSNFSLQITWQDGETQDGCPARSRERIAVDALIRNDASVVATEPSDQRKLDCADVVGTIGKAVRGVKTSRNCEPVADICGQDLPLDRSIAK